MNTVLLEYAVEVEKTGSITQAAGNLYMDQPNLSKAIKTLEESLGAPIFRRTPKGVVPTARGRIFLEYARNVLAQLEEMEALYKPAKTGSVEFTLSMPRASYISSAFSRFVKRIDRKEGMNLWLRETNSADTLRDVERGEYQLGIIRYKPSAEAYYTKQAAECGLKTELLLEYDERLLMSQAHPLASARHIESGDLLPYIEITHGDAKASGRRELKAADGTTASTPANRIYIFERGTQMSLLHENPDTYMWVSPMPPSVLTQHGLTEKPCIDGNHRYRDVLVYRNGYKMGKWERLFLEELEQVKADLVKDDCGRQ